ncbi:MAG: amidohydrolase family protein, partial [Acidobacteriota bacterium]
AVVTPGLIDAHSTVGLSGYLNQRHDQDQLERSSPVQPELRAIDAYNARERLVEWVRGFGVTTLHTGHGPGAVISGQTLIAKTRGETVDDAVMVEAAMMAASLGEGAEAGENGPKNWPGTSAKAAALLRAELIEAQEYLEKRSSAEPDKQPARNLRREALAKVLRQEMPLMITVQRHQDITTALRIQKEFGFDLVLDGAAEAYSLIESIKAAGVPVFVHATMKRAVGETENMTMESASILADAGIPIALQSGYEAYVPKTRVVLFEAGVAAAYGLGFERALASITLDAAKLLGIEELVGSLEVGKDGDLALYSGDPFEYTSHCVGVVIEGEVMSSESR